MIVALLGLTASGCDSLSRYLAGMDEPTRFTWEQGGVAVAPAPAPASREMSERRERIPGFNSDHAFASPEAPAPAAPSSAPTTLAQDLRDCEAPTLRAGAEGEHAAAPVIERAENSPVVAACMAEKGYRKVYQPRTKMF